MNKPSLLAIAGLALLMAGCVTNKRFETAVTDVTTRVDGVQGSIEQQGQKIVALDKRADGLAQDIQRVDDAAAKAREAGEAAMAKAEQAQKAARGKVVWAVTFSNRDLHFAADKGELPEDGKGVLDQFVEKLKSFDRMVFIEIQGHTDSSGNETYNRILGEKRAEAVRDYLHEKGVPLNLMQVISYGESKPIADNKTPEGRAANRRVEVLVLE